MQPRTLTVSFLFLVRLLAPELLGADQPPLQMSVYVTAGDVQRYLGSREGCQRVAQVIQSLQIRRLFLEGRRGDEYVATNDLLAARHFFAQIGVQCSGGIATVPGNTFGQRQNGGLTWLNWESEKTRQDLRRFFSENAPIFDELIIDDFFCTADTSPTSEQARGARSWGAYRRDLLVSLIGPGILNPARGAHSSVRLIIKYPQWYDRFHLFGYDPLRMSPCFDQVWVGTEVRDPKTRRMGYVQPTEGYVNFRWLSSLSGAKVRGAWFDHIECSAQNFVDQAYQSVLAGARELTLFHLGDLMEGHPGDALLAKQLTDLYELAARVQARPPRGMVFYKPPNSDSEENLYLADYLAMIGLPILPTAQYPESAQVIFLAVQAATDPDILTKIQQPINRGATWILTPAFVRALGGRINDWAGVKVGAHAKPALTDKVIINQKDLPLAVPLEVDGSLEAVNCQVLAGAQIDGESVPWLTLKKMGKNRIYVLNVRTFSEADFRDSQEWLLAPKPRGLSAIPQELGDFLRQVWLEPLGVSFRAPAGVALYLFGDSRCVYNFNDQAVRVSFDDKEFDVGANRWVWRDGRGSH